MLILTNQLVIPLVEIVLTYFYDFRTQKNAIRIHQKSDIKDIYQACIFQLNFTFVCYIILTTHLVEDCELIYVTNFTVRVLFLWHICVMVKFLTRSLRIDTQLAHE